jgi:hypothetical protein
VDFTGKWSGSWTPTGGVRDAVTVEFTETDGKIGGRFLNPIRADFSKVTVNASTGDVSLEAVDTGKTWSIVGKIQGTELKGTMKAGTVAGEVRVIKWTYVPR